MEKSLQKRLLKPAIVFCILIWILNIYLILTSPNITEFKENLEGSFSYPIYVSNTIDSYLRQVQPPLAPKSAYTITLVGDSMTDLLKAGQDAFRDNLKTYYKGRDFVIYNYGFGSTNILSVEERLKQDINYLGQSYPAVLGQQYDLILLESFGHNPLSEETLDEGLRKQTKALNRIMKLLRDKKPFSLVVFVATIAPNKEEYGKGAVELTQEMRNQWVSERESYIKNHIDYAKSHNISYIDVFTSSKDENSSGRIELFSASDHIHPSPVGVKFIFDKIAKEIYEQRIIPI